MPHALLALVLVERRPVAVGGVDGKPREPPPEVSGGGSVE